MRKRTLLISFALLSILMVGCGKEELKDIDNNQEDIEEIEIDDVGEVEGIDVPYDERRAESIKREELGEYITIRAVESVNVSDENKLIKMTVTDYKLSTLKPKEEYKDFYRELGVENPEEVSILDIIFTIENLSTDMLELDYQEGILVTNTGEEVFILLDFFSEKDEDGFKISEKEVKKGSTSAILTSNVEDIKSFKLVYYDLEFDFK